MLQGEGIMRPFLERFLRDRSGATIIDYSLVAAFLSLVIFAVVAVIGSDLDKPFHDLVTAMSGAASRQ
jgi:Flp pilus assembly pilin Flp